MRVVTALVLALVGLLPAGHLAAGDTASAQSILDLDQANRESMQVGSHQAVDVVFQRIVNQEVTVPDATRLLNDLGRPGRVVSHLRWVVGNAAADQGLRVTAYHHLVAVGGGSLTGGIEQFEAGLRDPHWAVRVYSARGLGFVPEARREAAGRTLVASLSTEGHDEVVRQHLESLYLVGSSALRDRLSAVLGLYRNTEAIPADRGRAALVLIKVLGVSAATTEFRKAADPEGTRRALAALAQVGSTTDGGFDTDPRGREEVRSFVWENLAADDPETRRAAIGPAFDLSLGPDRYTDTGERQLSINQAAWQVLKDASAGYKGDPELQGLLESRLRMFDETGGLLARKVWQERERERKQADSRPQASGIK